MLPSFFIAIALSRFQGATVFALGNTQSYLDTLKAQVPSIQTVCVDLGDFEASKKAIKTILPIHALVNNAGVAHITPFLDATLDEFDK